MPRLFQEECLIASNILRELSINQNFARARRRLHMEVVNNNRLGKRAAAMLFKDILKGIKKQGR